MRSCKNRRASTGSTYPHTVPQPPQAIATACHFLPLLLLVLHPLRLRLCKRQQRHQYHQHQGAQQPHRWVGRGRVPCGPPHVRLFGWVVDGLVEK